MGTDLATTGTTLYTTMNMTKQTVKETVRRWETVASNLDHRRALSRERSARSWDTSRACALHTALIVEGDTEYPSASIVVL